LGVTRNPWNLRIPWANWPHLSWRAARSAERLILQLKIVMVGALVRLSSYYIVIFYLWFTEPSWRWSPTDLVASGSLSARSYVQAASLPSQHMRNLW
jgi:hypothetical protein